MRILSQDGFYDLPYDSVWLRFEENDGCTIYAIPISSVVDDLTCDCELPIMGEYSSEAKARKAMEMLHHMYTYGEEAELPEIDEKQFAEDDDIGLSNAIFYNKNRFFRVSKKYFQFPSDDEVEV